LQSCKCKMIDPFVIIVLFSVWTAACFAIAIEHYFGETKILGSVKYLEEEVKYLEERKRNETSKEIINRIKEDARLRRIR
jgi:hypothetical protein